MDQIGKLLTVAGIILTAIGLLVWLFGNKLSWFGHLPGDIRIEKENFKFYAPIASMLLISLAISLVIWLIKQWSNNE